MPRIDTEALYSLLPAHHRLRDVEQDGVLHELMAVLAREGAVLEENIEQLLDDLFIETCSDWAVPYVAGIVGYRSLHHLDEMPVGPRAEAANTIALRRRKGTASVLEQLARDVTGWPARVVEYFELTSTCQHMNHIRPDHAVTVSLRDPGRLEALGTGFEQNTRSVDVRSINEHPTRRSVGGRHNFANIGIHLWRLEAQARTNVPAVAATAAVDEVRFLFDPLGAPRQLVNRPVAEDTITSLAEPVNVPGDISRRALDGERDLYYGRAPGDLLRSFEISIGGALVPVEQIEACDLSDHDGGWNHSPHPGDAEATVRVDPALGRISFASPPEGEVRTTHHTAFPAQIGGGEYDRAAGLSAPTADRPIVAFPSPPAAPEQHASIQAAIDSLPEAGGIVEVRSNATLSAPQTIAVAAAAVVELRAADGVRPILIGTEPIVVTGGDDATVVIDGVVLAGAPIEVEVSASGDSLGRVTLAHCTLVPGRGFDAAGGPEQPGTTSLTVDAVGVEVDIERCIVGPLLMTDTTNLTLRDSIVDTAAADPIDSAEGTAIAGLDGISPAGAVTAHESTVIGRIFARSFPMVSNSILHARSPDPDDPPIRAVQRQQGCMRFSWVPHDAITPRRYRCQPQLAITKEIQELEARTGVTTTAAQRNRIVRRQTRRIVPAFTALSASAAAYCQLADRTPIEIRTGASDESEMGVYHLLFAPQRETNLRIRLEEYLRFGLEAGVIHET